jgi:hypothetical protein
MQILLILWLRDMYHQGRTKESSFTKVVTTYGINRTSSESTQMDFSEGVYRLKKKSRLLKDVTHHHMEVIMGHSVLMQKSSKVEFSGQLCMKTQRILFEGVEHIRGTGTSIQ